MSRTSNLIAEALSFAVVLMALLPADQLEHTNQPAMLDLLERMLEANPKLKELHIRSHALVRAELFASSLRSKAGDETGLH